MNFFDERSVERINTAIEQWSVPIVVTSHAGICPEEGVEPEGSCFNKEVTIDA